MGDESTYSSRNWRKGNSYIRVIDSRVTRRKRSSWDNQMEVPPGTLVRIRTEVFNGTYASRLEQVMRQADKEKL